MQIHSNGVVFGWMWHKLYHANFGGRWMLHRQFYRVWMVTGGTSVSLNFKMPQNKSPKGNFSKIIWYSSIHIRQVRNIPIFFWRDLEIFWLENFEKITQKFHLDLEKFIWYYQKEMNDGIFENRGTFIPKINSFFSKWFQNIFG